MDSTLSTLPCRTRSPKFGREEAKSLVLCPAWNKGRAKPQGHHSFEPLPLNTFLLLMFSQCGEGLRRRGEKPASRAHILTPPKLSFLVEPVAVCVSSVEEAFWAFRVRADTFSHQHFCPVPTTAAPRSEAEAPMHHGQGFESDSALSLTPRAHSLEFWTPPQELTRGMLLLSYQLSTGWSSCSAIRDCGCQCLRQWASLTTNATVRHRACSDAFRELLGCCVPSLFFINNQMFVKRLQPIRQRITPLRICTRHFHFCYSFRHIIDAQLWNDLPQLGFNRAHRCRKRDPCQ